ncbi:T9SS type A sorting domain-containing protein [Bacteroidota bacterium]
MKFFIVGIILLAITSGFAGAQSVDSIKMGPGYGNDVYYSMSGGEIKQEPNNNWHIAFSIDPRSSTILTNDGTGVVLYTYPRGDIASWDTMSAAGIESWTPQYNSTEDWLIGAFDRNALGHPDYGWGLYNSISHDVVGDSLFVIKLPDESMKKLWIHKRIAMQNTYEIQYANLDGSMDTTVMIDLAPYSKRNFAYYSLETHTALDREPAESWDIVFTRYFDESIPYIVTGVLSNIGIEVAEVAEADTSSSCFDSPEFSDSRSVIGDNWKSFSMITFQWSWEDSLVYVVKDTSGVNHNLFFTDFSGSSTGKFTFVNRLEDCATGIVDVIEGNSIRAYPNPTSNQLSIEHNFQGSSAINIQLFDMTGRVVVHHTVYPQISERLVFFNTSSLNPGMYVLRMTQNGTRADTKIIVR